MKIILNSPDDLELAAKNGYYILRKYAEAVDNFHKVHGSVAKSLVEYWRGVARQYLSNPTAEINFKEKPIIDYEEQGRP